MARDTAEFTDALWEKIAPLLPAPQASPWGGPQPIPHRPCCEGMLWLWRTGARWIDLPTQ
jgi:transposase